MWKDRSPSQESAEASRIIMGIREGLKNVLQGFPVVDVAIITDAGGELLQCTIYISEAKATEEMEKEIKKYISDVYNLEDARIYVVRR